MVSSTNQSLIIGTFGANYLNGNLAELIIYDHALTDSTRKVVEKYLMDKYAPPVNLGSDINSTNTFCATDLDAGSRFVAYLWSTGSTSSTISVNSTGTYSVSVVDIFGRVSADTIQITYPTINYPIGNSIICAGDTKLWDVKLPKNAFSFLWQDNSTDSLFSITQAGEYYVNVSDLFGCSLMTDTLNIIIDNYSNTATLGNDTSLCAGNQLYLKSGAAQTVSYLWSDNSSNDSLVVNTSGQYWLAAQNIQGCLKNDTVNITIAGIAPTVSFAFNNSLCTGNVTQFTDLSSAPLGDVLISWQWDFGDVNSGLQNTSNLQNPSHIFSGIGIFSVRLQAFTSSGCAAIKIKDVIIHPYPLASFINTNACELNETFFNNTTNFLGDAAHPELVKA